MAENTQVKVIGSVASLLCTRVEWALRLKGVEYEYIKEDLSNKSELLLKLNPVHKKVPVLVHGDRAVAESLIILEYIDDTWNHNSLLPVHPFDKAMARFWAKFSDEKCLFGAWDACVAEGEEKDKAIEKAKESLRFLEKEIEGKKYFGEEEIGYLDLVAGSIPLWLRAMEEAEGIRILEAGEFPFLHEWSQNFIQIPIIRECLPPREMVLNYLLNGLRYIRSLPRNN